MSNQLGQPPMNLRPLSPSILDQLRADDDSLDYDAGATSPSSKRCPTFKDYAEKIKQLQKENFQLRVRIYLNERETGVKTSSSDIAVLFSQLPQLQNGNFLQPPVHSAQVQSSASNSSASSAFESLNNELDKVKAENEDLREKFEEKEKYFAAQITELKRQNAEICAKNEELSKELSEANSTIQRLNENQSKLKKNEEAIEKLACFAFGQNDEIDQLNAEWEEKLAEKNNDIARLEGELEIVKRKLASADNKIEVFRADLRKNESEKAHRERKIKDLSDCIREVSEKLIQEQNRNHKLRKKLEDKTAENLNRIALSPSSDKLESVQQLVYLLLDRLKEITDFVKTLFHLESQKVIVLPLLKEEHRASLLKSMEQCRLFSRNLEDIFSKRDQIADGHSASISHSFVREPHFANVHTQHSPSASVGAGHSRSMFSALDRVRLKSDGVQCNIVDASLISSLESANAYINQLKHDMTSLQRINSQLGQEKADLVSQVKSLESGVLRTANHAESTENVHLINSKLNEENRKLKKRLALAEDALKDLHAQHATLVGELKKLKSVNRKPILASVGSTVVDSNRPSDSTSPDLGIDSGHDGAVNSDDSNATNYKEENRILRTTNRELALKLKQTRQTLDMTLEKLNSTTKEKEQVEKAICRQLHKTHTILRQAKRSVEKFTNSQCQENIMPSS